MTDIIIIVAVLVVVGLAGWYIYKAKKNGKKCIGCPDSCCCTTAKKGESCCIGCSGCGSSHNE